MAISMQAPDWEPNYYLRKKGALKDFLGVITPKPKLTIERAREIASTVRYERNGQRWNLQVEDPYFAGPSVVCELVWTTAITCVKTGWPGHFRSGPVPVPENTPEAAFLRLVLATLINAEMHEVREHFLVGGARIFDPHQPLPPCTDNINISADGLTLEIPRAK